MKRISPIRSFLLPFLAFLALSSAWAMTTPMAGYPDEPAHIVRAAAVADGQLLPLGHDADGSGYFEVPASLADIQEWDDCFAHQPKIGAICQQDIVAKKGSAEVSTSAWAYNPIYYAIIGWPTQLTDDPHLMVYSMRLLTALVSSVLLGAAFHSLVSMLGLRRSLFAAAAFATPMIFFLSGAVNPNAWEITGGLALFTALLSLGYRREKAASDVPALVMIGLSASIVANMRGVSPIWVAGLGVIGLICISKRLPSLARRPWAWIALAVILLATLAGLRWASSTVILLDTAERADPPSLLTVIDVMFRRTIFEHAYVGLFGWTDTGAPLIAVVLIGGLGVLGILAAFWLGRTHLQVALGVAVAMWIVLPIAIQAWLSGSAGIIWQGRYTLVMYAAVIILASVTINDSLKPLRIRRPRTLIWLLGSAITCAHAYSFYYSQLRYAEGTNGTLVGTLVSPEWSPPGGALPWVLLTAIGCMGLTALASDALTRNVRSFEGVSAATAESEVLT